MSFLEDLAPVAGDDLAVAHDRLDLLEQKMLDSGLPIRHLPVVHRFCPGLYLREIFMPADVALTSRDHETEHPYMVLSGVAEVSIPGDAPILVEAGHVGITRPGTRRALLIHEDCRWLTVHPLTAAEERLRADGLSEAEMVALVEERILGKRERADGRNVFEEYKQRLAAAGLPGPHDGAKALMTEGER